MKTNQTNADSGTLNGKPHSFNSALFKAAFPNLLTSPRGEDYRPHVHYITIDGEQFFSRRDLELEGIIQPGKKAPAHLQPQDVEAFGSDYINEDTVLWLATRNTEHRHGAEVFSRIVQSSAPNLYTVPEYWESDTDLDREYRRLHQAWAAAVTQAIIAKETARELQAMVNREGLSVDYDEQLVFTGLIQQLENSGRALIDPEYFFTHCEEYNQQVKSDKAQREKPNVHTISQMGFLGEVIETWYNLDDLKRGGLVDQEYGNNLRNKNLNGVEYITKKDLLKLWDANTHGMIENEEGELIDPFDQITESSTPALTIDSPAHLVDLLRFFVGTVFKRLVEVRTDTRRALYHDGTPEGYKKALERIQDTVTPIAQYFTTV